MVDSSTAHARKLVANVCLHRALGPQTRFLRRNLDCVLDAHERDLEGLRRCEVTGFEAPTTAVAATIALTGDPTTRTAEPATTAAATTTATTSTNAASAADPDQEAVLADQRFRAGWNYPTKEMLDDLTAGAKPILRIDGLRLRQPHAGSGSSWRRKRRGDRPTRGQPQAGSRDDESLLDHLPAPEVEWRVPCVVDLALLDAVGRQVLLQTRAASVEQTSVEHKRSASSRLPQFEVVLEEAFEVVVGKIFAVEEGGGKRGARRWKRTVTNNYDMVLSIRCEDSVDTAELLARLEGRDASELWNLPSAQGVLRASWDGLPECPKDPLVVKRRQDKGTENSVLDFKLDVSCGWNRKQDSVLQRYNGIARKAQKLQSAASGSTAQIIPQDTLQDTDQEVKEHVLTWKVQNGLEIHVVNIQGHSCPLCKDRDHGSFARLQLHCTSHHDHFKFESEQPATLPDPSHRVVWISLNKSDEQPQKPAKPNTDRENWIAPARPFDAAAHAAGDDTWVADGTYMRDSRPPSKPPTKRGRPSKKGVVAGSSATSNTPATTTATNTPTTTTAVQTPPTTAKSPVTNTANTTTTTTATSPSPHAHHALTSVPPLPAPKTKQNSVPLVPDVTFYRHASKRRLLPGEITSKDDHAADVSWLRARQDRDLEALGITGSSKKFIVALDGYLDCEKPQAAVLLRDALVRFARGFEWAPQDVRGQEGEPALQRMEFLTDWKEKLTQFAGAGLLTQSDVDDCFEIARKAKAKARPRVVRDSLDDTDAGAGDFDESVMDLDSPANSIIAANGVPTAHKPAPRRAGLCTCGDNAHGARKAIACANPRCVRQAFHFRCVGIGRRENGWMCGDCSLPT